MEMTGLRPETDKVLEIACIITDSLLNVVAEGPVLTIHQSDEILNGMSPWCQEHHGASGLTERVRASRMTEAEAEEILLDFLQKWVPEKVSPLCGNSIGQDRRFLYAHLPRVEAYFHYRNLDVSSVKILAQRWAPEVAASFHKKEAHLALDDIRESIAELEHYRRHFFQIPTLPVPDTGDAK